MVSDQKSVIVGMSGGVDSSVCAYLLQQQGYHVTGVFMQSWTVSDDSVCNAKQDLCDARTVCDRLQITLKTVNFSQEYWDHVFQYFLDEYAVARTPNPDILCNQEIKFKAFLNYALENGADFIATGHYVRSLQDDDGFHLLKGVDGQKDQSYFLYTLNQQQLQHSLFPLGNLTKKEVRNMAEKLKLINHAKKDSTGICFIGEKKFSHFLKEYLLCQPGPIETLNGEIIGQHPGLMYYTLGQRQGLGIGGIKKYKEAPWYVLSKDRNKNTLIVDQDPHHPLLMNNILYCKEVHWISEPPASPFSCKAKIRYRQADQSCIIQSSDKERYQVIFDEPQWAITPGQSVVFYVDDRCIGGGIIY
jgi:tRNA-specific 2-thiouridylase